MAVRRKAESVMTSKGQLTVPASVRRSVGIKAGDRIQFEVIGPDRMTMTVRKKQDAFELLKSFPKLRSPEPLERAAINKAADEALGDKFSRLIGSERGERS